MNNKNENEKFNKREWEEYQLHFFWSHFSVISQLPSMSIPLGKTYKNGLPNSVQVLCKRGNGMKLLNIINQMESKLSLTSKLSKPVLI